MQKNNLHILSTRPLGNEIIEEAAEQHINIDCLSFIKVQPIRSFELEARIQQLSTENIIAVFTSQNAVQAVEKYLASEPHWKIFCIGQTTGDLVEKSFRKKNIAGTSENANALADLIIQKKPNKIFFFCGRQRRDELPEKLNAENIKVEEVIVYDTITTSHKVLRSYDGILFFSPSAVNSFFSTNNISHEVVLFAIGNTTADAIEQKVDNKIIIAEHPAKEALVKKMIAYFTNLGGLADLRGLK